MQGDTSEFELPNPQVGESSPDSTQTEVGASVIERESQAIQSVPPATPAPDPIVPITDPLTQGAQAVLQTQQSPQSHIANDVELIEKEWVSKAKNIIRQTKDDPYTQNKELSKVKADYVKARYNKDVKLSE